MTIKTFDANRVGGGTFEIEQDALTGEYKVKEIGFVKLPELKLPEIEQAAPVIPDPTPDDPTGEDPTEPGTGTGTGGGGSGGGGGDNQIDFTGATQLRNIGKEATGDSANLMNQATTLSSNLSNVDRTSLDQGAIKVEDIATNETNKLALKAYNDAIANYKNITAQNRELNASGAVKRAEAKGASYNLDIGLKDAQNQLNRARRVYEMTSGLDLEGTASSETIKAAPVISEDLQKFGPITTTGATGVPDMIVQGQPSLPDQNVFSKAKEVVSNSKPVQLMGIGIRTAGKVIGGAADAVLGVTEVDKQRQKNATSFFDNVSSKNYKTRGELGSNTDPGRLAGNPSVDLFAGMNKVSAKGNLERAGANRVDTRNNTIDRRGVNDKAYADANGLKYNPNGVSSDFHKNTKGMEGELDDMRRHNNNENIKSAKNKGVDTSTLNPNEMRNVAETGDPAGDPGGCVIATHAVNSGAFTADTKREAVRWCVKNLHRTWWGEAIRRGYRYYGQKAINKGNAKNYYQEFKNYVAFGTGKKRTLKTAWTFIYRTIQFFIKGVTIKK